MTAAEARDLVAALAVGASLEVPMSTRLYPDTEALRSVLVREGDDAFSLRTTFREFWAGHGWSLEQEEREPLTRSELEARLLSYPRERFQVPDPSHGA